MEEGIVSGEECRILGYALEETAKILSSKFHPLSFGLCSLFLIIAANNLTASTSKNLKCPASYHRNISTSLLCISFLVTECTLLAPNPIIKLLFSWCQI
jgi:hypothetical protein